MGGVVCGMWVAGFGIFMNSTPSADGRQWKLNVNEKPNNKANSVPCEAATAPLRVVVGGGGGGG